MYDDDDTNIDCSNSITLHGEKNPIKVTLPRMKVYEHLKLHLSMVMVEQDSSSSLTTIVKAIHVS